MAPRAWQCFRVRIPVSEVPRFSDLLASMRTLGIEERLANGDPLPFRQPWDAGPPPPPPAWVCLQAWFDDDDATDTRWTRIASALQGIPGATLASDRVEEGGWEESWKQRFEPIHVAPDLVVTPPWIPIPGAIVLEPGMAFGTGDHPTTRFCLDAIARLGRPGQTLLDVGCGSGILALAGAKRGMRVLGVDIDLDAVRIAREGAALNGLEADFEATPVGRIPGTFDLVVANVFAEEIARMADDLVRLTAGRLVVTGILAERVETVRRSLASMREDASRTDGEWVVIEYVPE